MPQRERQQSVLTLLKDLRGLDSLKELFWSELNYERVNEPLPRRAWTDTAAKALAEDPVLFAGGGANNDFHVIYARLASDRLLLGQERPVVSRLLRDHPYALFVFSNTAQDRWHFLNVKYDEKSDKRRLFRRITIGPEERLRTASERLALLDLDSIQPELFGLSPLAIQQCHDDAFDVEAVTKQFFKTFAELFHTVASDIVQVRGLEKEAGKLAQLLLDRLLFLYFIQKKGWLDGDPDYLYARFQECWKKDPHGHSYYSNVLYPLFLSLSDADAEVGSVGAVPFLNGGLFEESAKQTQVEQLEQARLNTKNITFKAIFDDLLERFNFTVTEDTPLDVEVAIDPEMLGKIFESLILQLEKDPDKDLRKMTGSYYTPRPIVHFMCQEALKEYLVTQLAGDSVAKAEMAREKVGALLVLPPADQLDEEQGLALKELFTPPEAKTLRQAILDCRICDPAVGSGAFPVGMLHEMVAAVARLDLRLYGSDVLKQRNYDYDLKKQIIESCLYGVDIQEQAVRLCELRLWLSLVVDYQIDPDKPFAKAIREVPSLPNLSYHILRGDSLLERLFGHVVQLDQMARDAKTKQLIESIQADKMSYFREGNTAEKRRLELKILAKQADLTERLTEAKLASMQMYQPHLLGDEHVKAKERRVKEQNQKLFAEMTALKTKVARAKSELERLSRQKGTLNRGDLDTFRRTYFQTGDAPTFVWRVDFAEVFGEKGRFDVMIGNPPYGITLPPEEYSLARYTTYNDSYALFIQRALDLLTHPYGYLSFITPTSWQSGEKYLSLRELLLERFFIRYVANLPYDMFESAYVDTSIMGVCIRPDETESTTSYMAAVLNKRAILSSPEDIRSSLSLVSLDSTGLQKQRIVHVSQNSAVLAIKIMQTARCKLGDILDGKRGIEAYKYAISPTPKRGWLKFFKGNLYRYRVENEGFDYVQIETAAEPYHRGPRLGARRIVSRSNRLMATFLHDDFVVKKDIYCFIPSGPTTVDDLWFYLGLLNSSIISYAYLSAHASATKDDFRQVSLQGLRDLPVSSIGSNEYRRIVQLTQKMQSIKTLSERTFEEYEQEIDSLFFRRLI